MVQSGTRSDQLVCLTDLIRTVAEILQADLPADSAEDSYSFLAALTGRPSEHQRQDVIHHSVYGYFAIRQGRWKLSCCPDSGGWTRPQPSAAAWDAYQREEQPLVQLNDLLADVGEQVNLAQEQPRKVLELRRLLDQQIAAGRSTPGPVQRNDVRVVVDKQPDRP